MQNMLTTLIQLSKNKYIEKETGYLICENSILGSIGYQQYRAYELNIDELPPNTAIKVYRTAEEVFKPESLASLENKAICLLHPEVDVTAENDSIYRKGLVRNVRQEDNVIKGDLVITDKDTIEKMKYIKCLSLGYSMDLDKNDSIEGDGTVFFARNIKYNHLALVPKGRSKVAQVVDCAIEDNNKIGGNKYMSLFHKDVKTLDAEKEVIDNEEIKDTEEEATKTDDQCEKANDKEDEAKEVKDEKEETAKEDTVTKEIEKRIASGNYTKKDLEKLLSKLSKGENEKIDEDYKSRENEKKANDAVSIPLEEYKSLLMAQKGMVYGNDTSAFVKNEETKPVKTVDAELERKSYYKKILNPHRNPNWRSECGSLDDLLEN